MSSRKNTEALISSESQKQTLTAPKVKQKRTSNASETPPGPINLTKKIAKKNNLSQKTSKNEQKNVKPSKVIKKNDKEGEESDEKKDIGKKPVTKQKLKEKSTTKIAKTSIKEINKGKNSSSGNIEKGEKLTKPKKVVAKKSEDKEEKKHKEKIQKERKVKEIKKKSIPKTVKKIIEDVDSTKSRIEIKLDKKNIPKRPKIISKNKVKLNSNKKIDDNPSMECMDVVKDENPDDVALLQVFQLKNGPVCDFDGGVCNTITIRQDNTCIKIKEISVSQLPYSVKTEDNEKLDVTSTTVKKESKQNTEIQGTIKQNVDKQKPEKLKNEKQKTVKHKTEKLKIEKQKSEKPKIIKPKIEKQKIVKPVTKSIKVDKKTKPLVIEKIKPKGKTKVTPKPKAKGRPVSKRPRVASLNAIAKVHCLYENESKSALIDAMAASATTTIIAPSIKNKNDSDVEISVRKGKRTSKRTTPGLKSVGRHWDMHDTSSTNSSSSGIFFLFLKTILVF